MWKRLGLAAFAGSVALGLYACVQLGVVRFYRGEEVIFTAVLAGGEKLVLGRADLGVVADTPIDPGQVSFHLDSDLPLVVTMPIKGGAPVVLGRYVEAHLFARDPQEVFETLSGLGRDHAEWHRVTWLRETSIPSLATAQPWFLPDDAVVPYTFPPHRAPIPTVLKPVRPRAFWRLPDPAARGGPGNDPGGLASVKAVRVLPAGLCSRVVPIERFVNTIGNGLVDGFVDGICGDDTLGSLLEAQAEHLDIVSYLSRRRPDRNLSGDDDAGGGLLLQGRFSVHGRRALGPVSLAGCTVNFTYDYRFYLNEGRLALAHTRHQFDYAPHFELCNGIPTLGIDSVAPRLAEGLEARLEKDFLESTTNEQVFTPVPEPPEWRCDPSVRDENVCLAAARQLELGIRSGVDAFGLSHGSPGAAAERLIAAARRPENWRCERVVGGDPCRMPRGRCQYTVRAKRLNVTPHDVELVWFDEVDEYDNPTLALFVASFAPDALGGPLNYHRFRALCSRPPQPGVLAQNILGANSDNYYNKHFVRYGFQGARCQRVPPPPAPPPPAVPPPIVVVLEPTPRCPCSSDAECNGGECDRATGLCRNLCTRQSHCQFPDRYCDEGKQLCGGADCVNNSMCHSHERCSLQLNRCMPWPPH